MSKTKNPIIDAIKNRAHRVKAYASTLWRRTPLALRYAGLYLLAMVIISSMMFWRFNPARYSYNPDPGGGAITVPGGDSEPGDEGDPEDSTNGDRNDGGGQGTQVFNPARGDKLFMSLAGGTFLNLNSYIFYQNNNVISHRFVKGVHISGEEDADVYAAWSGTVIKVAEGLIGLEIWIENGDWIFIHRGLKRVTISPEDKVHAGQKIGLLAMTESGGYNSSFLELSVMRDNIILDEEDLLLLLESPGSRH